jgi:hypothetical protein
MNEWKHLPEPLQLQLATEANRQASERMATYAEMLADEMEAGAIPDWGGHEALRFFASVVRSVHTSDHGVGHA